MQLYSEYKKAIEQKINFSNVKFPRQVLRLIRENFKNNGNIYLFTYISLLSLARKFDNKCPEVSIENTEKICAYLNMDSSALREALHKLEELKLIRIGCSRVFILDYEANKANGYFKNTKINIGIKTNKGFVFVPKFSIKRILSCKGEKKFSSADIVTLLFTELIFNDDFVHVCNHTGYAVCYFDDSCKTSYRELSVRFNKSKSTIHGILKKCEKLSILKAVNGKFKNSGTYIYSDNYIYLFGWKESPNKRGEFLELIDY